MFLVIDSVKRCIGQRNMAFIKEGKLEPFFQDPMQEYKLWQEKKLGKDFHF